MTHQPLRVKVRLVGHQQHGELVPVLDPQDLAVKLVDLFETGTNRNKWELRVRLV